MDNFREQLESIRRFKGYPLLEEKNKELSVEVEEVKRLNADLSEQIKQLSETAVMVGDEKKTLSELRELLAKIKSDEIKAEAQQLFNNYRFNWNRLDRPREVSSRAVQSLSAIIGELRKPSDARSFDAACIGEGLPHKVEEMFRSEVNARIDAEFLKRVEDESTRKAEGKLEKLMREEWPKWHRLNVAPAIAELAFSFKSNVFDAVKGAWTVDCDKCQQRFNVTVAAREISMLARLGYVDMVCQNPSCRDLIGGHRIRQTLEQFIDAKIVARFKESSASGRYSTRM